MKKIIRSLIVKFSYIFFKPISLLLNPLFEKINLDIGAGNISILARNQSIKDSFDEFKEDISSSLIFFDNVELRECCAKLISQSNPSSDNLFLEFGVWEGHGINLFASLNNDLTFYGFDTFEGLPEEWKGTSFIKGQFDLKGELPPVRKNVKLVKGLIENTLPQFLNNNTGKKISFVHIDTDIYSACKCILENIKEHLADDAIILFDELMCYPGWRLGEYKALNEVFSREEYDYIAFGRENAAIKIKSVMKSV